MKVKEVVVVMVVVVESHRGWWWWWWWWWWWRVIKLIGHTSTVRETDVPGAPRSSMKTSWSVATSKPSICLPDQASPPRHQSVEVTDQSVEVTKSCVYLIRSSIKPLSSSSSFSSCFHCQSAVTNRVPTPLFFEVIVSGGYKIVYQYLFFLDHCQSVRDAPPWRRVVALAGCRRGNLQG